MSESQRRNAEDESDSKPARQRRGPLEDRPWPEQLRARVVTPGPQPRIHGFDIEGDLAHHYGWTDLTFLALTGELPTDAGAAGFNVAGQFLAGVSTAHGSVHASVLARICGATPSATVGVAAVALGEQSRRLLDEHLELLQWCASPEQELPARYRSSTEADRASVERLVTALAPSELAVPGLEQTPTRDAALILVLRACGLRRRQQLEAAITLFRLPAAIAEAFQERVGNFQAYPINLPRFIRPEDP